MQPAATLRSAASANNGVFVLLVVSIAINYLDRGALSVAAPNVSTAFALSPVQMGLLFSAFFWSYSVFQLVAGWIVDRYPVRWVYAGGFFLWSIATALTGVAQSFYLLLASRLLLGVGESVAYPACSKFLAQNVPETRRGLANAWIDAASKLGPGITILAGGLLVSLLGWRALFLGGGLLSLLWLIPWISWTRGDEASPSLQAGRSPRWSDLLRRREPWGTSLGMFSLGYAWYFLISWLPSYLVTQRGLSMNTMAVFGSVPFWVMAASSVFFGWTSDRRIRAGADAAQVRRRYVVLGLVLCALTIVPAALVHDNTVSILLISAACFVLGLFTSNVWAATQTLAGPVMSGKWTGMQNAIGNLGGVVSPLVTGWIVQQTGSFNLAFVVAAVVLIAGALVYFVLVPEVRALDWATE
jgi:Sugar phosphate permease